MKVSSSRRGFTLTEIAVVLGIVGLILGAIWTAAAHVYQQKKVNQEVEEIQDIVQAVRSLYATRGVIGAGTPGVIGAAGCMNTLLVSSNSFPSDMVTPGAPADLQCGQPTVHNPFGETVDVGYQTGWSGLQPSPTAFEILVASPAGNMSSAECVAVLSAIVGSSLSSYGLTGVGGGGFATTQTIAGIADPSYFQNCGVVGVAPGYFTLQYSLK
jgi:prepilin-type N-terminal cleavage/methylation domain-containing protein